MIYHFCNNTYGQPFLAAAKEYANKSKTALTLVYSDRRDLPRNPLRRIVADIRWLKERAIEESRLSAEHGLPIIVADDVNAPSFHRRMRSGAHGVVTGFNQIFKQKTIDRFASLVNIHPSLLPFYRGPVPSYWCLRNGEQTSGYTLHKVTAKIDSGDVLHQGIVAIEPGDTAEVLDRRIADAAVPTFRSYLNYIAQGGPWTSMRLDAAQIYQNHMVYGSFPESADR